MFYYYNHTLQYMFYYHKGYQCLHNVYDVILQVPTLTLVFFFVDYNTGYPALNIHDDH